MRKITGIMWIIIIFVIVGGNILPVLAAPDQEQKGCIQVVLPETWDKTKREGIIFSCTKIGEIKEEMYEILPKYESTAIDLNNLKTSLELDRAAKRLSGFGIEGEVSIATNASGSAVFTSMEEGVYLIQAKEQEEYDVIDPVIVAVPKWDEANQGMTYDIKVEPKHAPRNKVERSAAPQTGLKTNAKRCFLAGGMSFILAGVIGFGEWRKTKKNEE